MFLPEFVDRSERDVTLKALDGIRYFVLALEFVRLLDPLGDVSRGVLDGLPFKDRLLDGHREGDICPRDKCIELRRFAIGIELFALLRDAVIDHVPKERAR